MAYSITVKVSELYDHIKEMKDDGMDYAEIYIVEDQNSDYISTFLCFNASSKKEPLEYIDYEEIEAVKIL
ncbi:hypothetical protein [Candidatus Clostridium helianthi]|uniref:Phage protein n=1 Tax=Candidatus Clostridium helianthi TaxID=3381660 RepID=A0ABW8S3J6_9CLOT